LKPPIAAVLRELSALTGNSQSALVAELLEEAAPVFTRMVRILRAAEQAKRAVKDELVSGMEAAQTRLEGQLGLALTELDAFEGQLLGTAERVLRRRGRSAAVSGDAAAQRQPPISNRGVRSPKKTTVRKMKGGGHGSL
ncbi:hypothetical protein, partial [Devosia sp.]|uniref:hypothetical protein n=1 Tax=Devosia sp. TaxID=1871048 RepID=UPI0019E9D05D